ncbi:MAG: polyhydroxyalkanoate depolymerase [Pseudomonadota bacterium]
MMPFASDGSTSAIAYDLIGRLLPRPAKPAFDLRSARIGERLVSVQETAVVRKPFCTLLRFERDTGRSDPRLLIVSPLSGHFAGLLRDMVAALLPEHDLFVTDWTDARLVPPEHGPFGLSDNIGYVREFIRHLGPDIHVVGLCQSAIPSLAATALLAAEGAASQPRSLTLLGGLIDPRLNPTRVERLLAERPPAWFEQNTIFPVSAAHPAAGRRVYPGSLQLLALMGHLARHVAERRELFYKLVEDDGQDAASHPFFTLYTAVMDLAAEFFLESVKTVFQDFALPRGHLIWSGQPVELGAISKTALMTVEAELDDVSGPGQTRAAQDLCVNVPSGMRRNHSEPGIGHFGLFHGRHWRAQIMPRIRDFIRSVG